MAEKEVALQKSLVHDNIVKFVESFVAADISYIILEVILHFVSNIIIIFNFNKMHKVKTQFSFFIISYVWRIGWIVAF